MTQEQVEKGIGIVRNINFIKENISYIDEALKKEPLQNGRFSDCFAMVNNYQINIPIELGVSLLADAKGKYLKEINDLEEELAKL